METKQLKPYFNEIKHIIAFNEKEIPRLYELLKHGKMSFDRKYEILEKLKKLEDELRDCYRRRDRLRLEKLELTHLKVVLSMILPKDYELLPFKIRWYEKAHIILGLTVELPNTWWCVALLSIDDTKVVKLYRSYVADDRLVGSLIIGENNTNVPAEIREQVMAHEELFSKYLAALNSHEMKQNIKQIEKINEILYE